MISPGRLPLLIDSDVLIDYLRGRAEAIEFLDGVEERLLVSAISVAELFAGAAHAGEAERLRTFLAAFEVQAIDSEVAETGGAYRAAHGKPDGTGLADALIAASAEGAGARLVTRNQRHFRMLDDVLVPY